VAGTILTVFTFQSSLLSISSFLATGVATTAYKF